MDRESFKKKAAESIDDVFDKIEALEKKRDEIKGDAKLKYDEALADLQKRKADLMVKYEALQKSGGEKWDEVKTAFSEASEDFKHGFSKISALVRS